jgi:hypothetical protein
MPQSQPTAQPQPSSAEAERERFIAAVEAGCYDRAVAQPTADQLRAFAQRDWSARARTKSTPVVNGPASAVALSEMLWRHMREVDPCWPDAAQRRADLEHHLHLESLKQRISNVLFPR